MKKITPLKKVFLRASLLMITVSMFFTVNSQTIPELVFMNPVLENGSAGQNGARYRFSNVGPDLDAVVEIRGRSSNEVVVNNIDMSSTGWNKAFQPEIGIPGTVAANKNWWVEFRMTFYKAGTTQKKTITKFVATGIDIDGDGQSLQEWVEMYKVKSVSFSPLNNLVGNLLGSVLDLLDLNNCGDDYKITGPVTNFVDIDTLATSVMATYDFEQKDRIDFKIGGKTNASSTTVGVRMNSIWFKQFDLNPPLILPVKLIDFSARYNKTNVTLTWKSSEEISFSHYLLEHSSDGIEYSQTALIFGAAENGRGAEYSYPDKSINGRSGLIYYRLKMVDIDGNFTYSTVRIVRLGGDKQTITLATYPNPVTSELRITLPASWQSKPVNIDLYNISGQKIKGFKTGRSSQTEIMTVNELQKGVYFIKAVCENEIAQQTIIKN